ncbi:uncharacterized protein LOC6579212 [Drosophila mojavensis]|nr:uncharacterized protein LOC6579212 [Drosophila mojavensis]XP_017867685.1 PREDICTED: uncharacterized protein LOC108616773 [Drosophila arizonae]XP_017958938.1 uncharacterized protein LOC108653134 [Drosophila navojoa]EDW09043.1 uncharacterized protein Dmoj_GI19244 [Drosophila mojavensis]
MCLYLGVVEHLVDVVAYCVCRMLELTLLTFVMMCNTAKAKLSSSNNGNNNNQLVLMEQ